MELVLIEIIALLIHSWKLKAVFEETDPITILPLDATADRIDRRSQPTDAPVSLSYYCNTYTRVDVASNHTVWCLSLLRQSLRELFQTYIYFGSY